MGTFSKRKERSLEGGDRRHGWGYKKGFGERIPRDGLVRVGINYSFAKLALVKIPRSAGYRVTREYILRHSK